MCAAAKSQLARIALSHHPINSLRQVPCCTTDYKVVSPNALDQQFEKLLAPNQDRRSVSQTIR
jgi:hypothetical protein